MTIGPADIERLWKSIYPEQRWRYQAEFEAWRSGKRVAGTVHTHGRYGWYKGCRCEVCTEGYETFQRGKRKRSA